MPLSLHPPDNTQRHNAKIYDFLADEMVTPYSNVAFLTCTQGTVCLLQLKVNISFSAAAKLRIFPPHVSCGIDYITDTDVYDYR